MEGWLCTVEEIKILCNDSSYTLTGIDAATWSLSLLTCFNLLTFLCVCCWFRVVGLPVLRGESIRFLIEKDGLGSDYLMCGGGYTGYR